MGKYFLIDTNVWVQLLLEDKNDYLINCLQELAESKRIILLVPSVLANEWKVEKIKQLNHLKKLHSNLIDFTSQLCTHFIRPYLQNDIKNAERKAEKIDFLLKKGQEVKISKEVKSSAIDQADSKKAPFHNNNKAYNDYQFYFSAIEFFKENDIREFVFVTKNINDFGKPDKPNEDLHPDLLVEEITTYYFNDLGRSLHYFKNLIQLPAKIDFEEKPKNYKIYLVQPHIDGILYHLFDTLIAARSQLEFIPTSILARISPFRVDNPKNNYSYYTNFCIYTNNEELFELFNDMLIGSTVEFVNGSKFENTQQNIQTATKIIQILNRNHIFSIANIHNQKKVDINFKQDGLCQCTRCCFERFEFSKAIAVAEKNSPAIEDRIKAGYVFYQLGFYDKAIIKFYEVYKEAQEKGLNIFRIRAACNLLWLKPYVSFYDHPELGKIRKPVSAIDLNNEYRFFANASSYEQEIASFYHLSYFHLHYSDDINEMVDKIEDHFRLQLNGGYSNNNNYWNLVSLYSEFESFLRYNCLTFSKFTNFKRIFDKYTTSLFTSLNLNEYQDIRPLALNDYALTHLVFYGDPQKIGKGYNSLTKNLIKYVTDEGEESFTNIVRNFFSDNEKFQQTLLGKVAKGNDFTISYGQYFSNILVVLTIVDFDVEFLKEVNKHIFSFVKNNKIRQLNTKYVGWFIQRMRTHLSSDELYDYFKLFIEDQKFHFENLFYAFPKKSENFCVDNNEDYNKIISNFFEKCPKCGEYHSTALFSIYALLKPSFKRRLRKKIENTLHANMDIELYYNAAIRGVINYKKMFNAYLEKFVPPKEKPRRNPFFGEGEVIYPKVNELCNIVFKNRVKLPEKFVEEFKGLSNYYDWLIDMKRFDYSKFNPLWILQYPTSYFLKAMFKIPDVRKMVKKYLRNNYQPTLAKYYAEYV